MSDPTLTPETVEKALSRKPIEGHTPGPWKDGFVIMEGDHNHIAVVGGNVTVALTGYKEADDEELSKANAHLIAAAPDLQAENQTLAALCRQQHEALKEAVRVLDNDLGDTDPPFPENWTDEDIRTADPKFYACMRGNTTLALMPQGESDDTTTR